MLVHPIKRNQIVSTNIYCESAPPKEKDNTILLLYISTGTEGVGKCVYSLSTHPNENTILSGSYDLKIRLWNVSRDGEVNEPLQVIQDSTSSGWAYGGNWSVHFDATGQRILSTEPQSKSLRIYSKNGKMGAELKGHLDCIKKIRLVPGKILHGS